jgi:hypothetical protein
MHIYEKELEDVDEVTVTATKSSVDATLTIYIFKDDRFKKDTTLEAGSVSNTISFEYVND